MAENEIVKHVEAAYEALKRPNTNWLHKLKEVLIEIAIIVFAVTLSIWFHNWSDSQHEHREEREFLRGMKTDIQADLENARGDSAFYATQLYRLGYFQRVAIGQSLSPDLRNNIINLHEEAVKHAEILDGYYTDYINRMGSFVQEHASLSPDYKSILNSQDLLRNSQMRFLMVYGTSFLAQNVISANDTCIVRCQRLMGEIDQELNQ